MRLRNPPDLQHAMTVSLLPCTDPDSPRKLRHASPVLCLILLCLFGVVIAKGAGLLTVLGLGLLLIGTTASFLLSHDYCYALQIERGRVYILRNGVAIFDASVLAGTPGPGMDGHRVLLSEGRVEALRCRAGEPPSYVFGVPILALHPVDRLRLRRRLAEEVAALSTVPRQLELLDDPDVQAHLLCRLRASGLERPSALHAELLRLAQGNSERSALAQALLFRSLMPGSLGRPKSLPH